jgi:hypothetical protein
MRIPRALTLVLVTAFALLAACGDGSDTKSGTATTTKPPVIGTTSTSSPAGTTTVPSSTFGPAIWPWAGSALRFRDPLGAARSFATAYLHMTDPVAGAFQPGDSRSGEVPIRPSTTGPVTTVAVRRLGNDGSWWVLGAATDNIRLTEPAALATIASPVAVRGTSTAFEATVNLEVRQDGNPAPLTKTFVMGGANGQMGPFTAAIDFRRPTSRAGGIVLYTVSPADGRIVEATAIRVGFGSE